MKSLLFSMLVLLMSCAKASTCRNVRVITFAVNQNGEYVRPTNTTMYLNKYDCVCFPDSVYGYNTDPTFFLPNVNCGDELRILSFVNAGEEIQYKTIRVYVDDRVVFDASNLVNIDKTIKIN